MFVITARDSEVGQTCGLRRRRDAFKTHIICSGIYVHGDIFKREMYNYGGQLEAALRRIPTCSKSSRLWVSGSSEAADEESGVSRRIASRTNKCAHSDEEIYIPFENRKYTFGTFSYLLNPFICRITVKL